MSVHPVFVRAIQAEHPAVAVTPAAQHGLIQTSSGATYIAKLGTPAEKEHFIGEAESLKAMNIAAPGLAPRLVASGVMNDEQAKSDSEIGRPYFLSEYKNLGSLTDAAAKRLGKRLATEMHGFKGTHGFGFHVPTFCGSTKQDNGWHDTWEECYDALIGGLLARLKKHKRYKDLCAKGEEVQKRVIPALLGSIIVQPVLLHGDLWSGNIGTDRVTGEPVIYDPASYFGHNEADLAIGRMFGGIPKAFINTYHQYLPKTDPEDQYELRSELYQLYHYLNHTVLFGGSYADGAMRKMDILLRAFPEAK